MKNAEGIKVYGRGQAAGIRARIPPGFVQFQDPGTAPMLPIVGISTCVSPK